MVGSPCIKVCKLENNYCIGCFRSIDEIRSWKNLSDEQKLIILDELFVRKPENSDGKALDRS
jgi:predicted Fe-S protein YdhL (DUF1289 family)